MKAADAAMEALRRIQSVDKNATSNATRTRQGSRRGANLLATTADRDLADLLGIEGSRAQFLGAVDLVAHFDQHEWDHDDALDALALFWGRGVESLSAVEWILSAAHADRVRGRAHSVPEVETADRTHVAGSGFESRRGESGAGIDLASS